MDTVKAQAIDNEDSSVGRRMLTKGNRGARLNKLRVRRRREKSGAAAAVQVYKLSPIGGLRAQYI